MSQRLISFDVGIKNMAYCIFDNDTSLNIVEWNVLNLCESSPVPCCQETLKSGKVCGKKAKYSKNTKYVCEKHAKLSTEYLLPNKEYTSSSLKKMKLEEIQKLLYRHLPSSKSTKKQDIVNELQTYFQSKTWSAIPNKTNASNIDLISIGRELYSQLSANPLMKTVTHVIIENQISPIANRMKTLQGMLAQHFISLGVLHIEFVSSGNKLKHFEEKSEAKTAYQKHKKDGIFYCETLLNKMNLERWLAFFSQFSSKKDDLADCFLQGLWWIKKGS